MSKGLLKQNLPILGSLSRCAMRYKRNGLVGLVYQFSALLRAASISALHYIGAYNCVITRDSTLSKKEHETANVKTIILYTETIILANYFV